MQTFFRNTTLIGFIFSFVLTSTGLVTIATPQVAQAQGGDIVSFVISGSPVLDGCDGIGGSKYQAIAADLGIDLEGGVRGGLSALGDELSGAGVGDSLLGGLQDIGSSLAGSGIGKAVGGLGSSIGDAVSGIGGGVLSAALPGVGNILGGVVGGLFGGGGPDEVVEEGLRKIIQQGQQIALYESRKVNEKERCLDSLARQAGQEALRELTNESVDWLQEGFEQFDQTGNPGYVDDLEEHQRNTSDYEFKGYVEEASSEEAGSFSGTCNFLRRPILNSLTAQQIREGEASGIEDLPDGSETPGTAGGCDLTGDDMSDEQAQAFTTGDFSAGGWEGFARSASDGGSSPIGAYLQQERELNSRISAAQQREREQLQWGEGFLADESEDGFTPGSVVQGITERLFQSDIERMELIDEMGEIAGNLANTLIGKITGDSDASGLSTISDGNTVGGNETQRYEYMARSLGNRIAEQLRIERDIAEALEVILPLYQDDEGADGSNRVRTLISNADACLSTGHLANSDADQILGSILQSFDTFNNTVLEGRVKVDWRGDPLSWTPVVREESEKMIGWNGRDYNWKDDGVQIYYNQDQPQGCELGDGEDWLNSAYGTTTVLISEPDWRFNGLFANLETTDEGYSDPLNRETYYPYEVWRKYVCVPNITPTGSYSRDESRWYPVGSFQHNLVGDEEATGKTLNPYQQRKYARSQCDLVEGEIFGDDGDAACIYPAHRPPRIISGETYKEDSSGDVSESSCNARSDAGTHYFVRGGEDTWTARECIVRNSPQGAPVEWEPNFPESAEQTDFDAYATATISDPLDDQAEFVNALNDLMVRLENESNRDVFQIQQDYYLLQDRFNTRSGASSLRDGARRFVRNVRELNQIMAEDDDCSDNIQSLNSFGSEFLNYNEQENSGEENQPPVINSFSVSSQAGVVSWEAEAESCQASASPSLNDWSGSVSPVGSRRVSAGQDTTLTLSCSRAGETVSRSQTIRASQSGPQIDPRTDGPTEL